MIIYLAPMEGITGFVVRNAFARHFSGIDKFFTPFIPMGKKWGTGIKRDIDPANNRGINLVPQGITNKAEEIFRFEERLLDLGYDSYNINLGCPSGTVTAKGRGSGMLRDPEVLDRFLDFVYSNTKMKVSVKTRIGFDDEGEWEELLSVFKKYPLSEFIIHPRLKRDMYSGQVRLNAYDKAVRFFKKEGIITPLCYNGDIRKLSDYNRILNLFSETDRIMIGRGFFFRPWISMEIKEGNTPEDYLERTGRFLWDIFEGYSEIFSGERDVIMHMKEIWGFLAYSFDNPEKNLKAIRKCNSKEEYHSICAGIIGSGYGRN